MQGNVCAFSNCTPNTRWHSAKPHAKQKLGKQSVVTITKCNNDSQVLELAYAKIPS